MSKRYITENIRGHECTRFYYNWAIMHEFTVYRVVHIHAIHGLWKNVFLGLNSISRILENEKTVCNCGSILSRNGVKALENLLKIIKLDNKLNG